MIKIFVFSALFLMFPVYDANSQDLPLVALIEHDFPIESNYETDYRQAYLSAKKYFGSSFYPNNINSTGRYNDHAHQVYWTYRHHKSGPLPILINYNLLLPLSIEAAIQEGVKFFSISIGMSRNIYWKEFEEVIKKYPEILFVAAAPHIAGNFIPLKLLNEYPSKLAFTEPNVILAGCLNAYDRAVDRTLGKRKIGVGSYESPYWIDNLGTEKANLLKIYFGYSFPQH